MSVHLRIDVDDALEPDAREPKLPKWAQELLAEQRRVVQRLHAYALEAQLATVPNDSDAVLRPYGDTRLGLGPIGLGRYAQVRWPLGPRREDGREGAYVDVRLASSGEAVVLQAGTRLVLRSSSANTVYVTDERYP